MNEILPYELAKTRLTPGQKVAQLFMPAAFINDSEEEIQKLEALIRDYGVGGLCFFHSRASAATNFEGKRKVEYNEHSLQTLKNLIARCQKAASIPLLIAIDAEWGLAMRIENTPQYPYAITLGAIRGQDGLIYEVGRNIALDCKKAGIHWNFAPVADINLNPENPVIGYRSFGEDKKEVAQKAIAFMQGMQSGGVLCCAKHFPGHGDTTTDSHLGLPVINKDLETLKSQELYPFAQMIAAGVEAIMVGHLSVPALGRGDQTPATLSPAIIQEVLRNDMRFQGVVVSDALNMHSVSRLYPEKGRLEWEAFHAGNEVLCFAEHVEEGISTILQHAPAGKIEQAFGRVWELKRKALQPASGVSAPAMSPETLNRKLAAASLSMVLGNKEDIDEFRKSKAFILEVSNRPGRAFLGCLQKEVAGLKSACADPSATSLTEGLAGPGGILVALYPPSVKPPNNFGFSTGVLQALNRLLEEREVVVYNFGNPYVLNLLAYQKAKAVVQVYQDFGSFQENAALHFLGRTQATGILPVTLKNILNHDI